MINTVKKVLKGILIGIGSILPGVSGGMIAAAFNIYKELVDALDQFLKHPIKSIVKIWEYLLGIFIGIVIGFILIKTVLSIFPIPMTLLFIGLIIGGIPEIYHEVKNEKKKWHHFLIMFLMMAVMIGVLFLSESTPVVTNSWYLYLIYFLIGFLMATSLIIPGLSGTMILMALGYYTIMMTLGDDFIRNLASFNFSELVKLIPMLLVVFAGLAIGLLLLSKLLSKAINKFKTHFYFGVLGIILVSPINIIYSLQMDLKDNIFDKKYLIMWIVGIILVPVGIFIARLFLRKKKDDDETKEIKRN